MKTIAVDFETANEERGSACALGLAWIENGVVTRQEVRLIRPKEMRFASMNIAIHGIRPDDVADKPEFPEVFSEFATEISGGLVLAHNAAFDIGVIRATLDKYDLPCPEFTYFCTAKIARQVWPNLLSASLPEVARTLGIEFEHHEASADAWACAQIALAAVRKVGASSIADIPNKIWLRPGKLTGDGYSPCSIANKAGAKPSSVTPTTTDWDTEHPLYQRSVVFTGTLGLMKRHDACQIVVNLGGLVHDRVKRDTDFLVVATDAYDAALATGKMSGKMKSAKDLIDTGLGIEVLPEDEFYRLCL